MKEYFCTSCYKMHKGEPAKRIGNRRWCEPALDALNVRNAQIARERRATGTAQSKPLNGAAHT